MNTNKIYKLLVALFILVGVCLFVPEGSEVQAASKASTDIHYEEMQIDEYRSGDEYIAPKPTVEGYEDWIFAGWFKEMNEANAISKTTKTGTYYAKFVPAEVLSVKCQVQDGTKAGQEGNSKMRIISTIDSKRYNKVGFDIVVEGREEPINYESTTVAKSIVARNEGVDYDYSPNIFDLKSNYFITVTITNIPRDYFDNGFYIKPYWVTKDNTKVYGVERYARVEDYYLDIVNVPVRLYSNEVVANGTVEVDYGLKLRKLTSDAVETDAFTYVGYDMGSLLSGVTVTDNATDKKVICAMPENATVTKADGMLVNLRFTKQTAENNILPKANTFNVTATLTKEDGEVASVIAPSSVYHYYNTEYTGAADTDWYYNKVEGQTEFVITSPDELYGLASLVNAGTFGTQKVYLASNITVNDTDIDPTAEDWATVSAGLMKWTPIGKSTGWSVDATEFQGKFDGQGHTIRGLYADETSNNTNWSKWCAGLFGSANSDAEIKHVKIENSYFKSEYYAGGVVGLLQSGTIDNVYSSATVVATTGNAGGITGGVRYSSSSTDSGSAIVQNSWFGGSATTASIGGGIVGYCACTKDIIIENCLNEGTVNSKNAGGIVGQSDVVIKIEDCLNTGTVDGTSNVGTVIGYAKATPTTTDVYALAVSGKKPAGNGSITVTEISNKSDIHGYAALADNQLGNKFDFDNTWVVRQANTPVLKTWCESGALYKPDTEWAGSGTEKDPWIIKTASELYGLANNVNIGNTYEGKYLKLGANITINSGTASRWEDEVPKYNWPVIGAYGWHTDYSRSFAGSFDGAGYTVKGLYANRTGLKNPSANDLNSVNNWCVALFGRISEGSIVKNVEVTNSYFEGGYYIAGIVGDSQMGTIQNVYSDAVIKATGGNSGGITGRVVDGTVENAWFDGSVTNAGQFTGGIAGVAANQNAVNNCLATGEITSTRTDNNNYIGGLVGGVQGNSSITNSLSTAKITSANTYCVGAVVGGVSTGIEVTLEDTYTVEGICTALVGVQVKPAEAGTIVGGATACTSLTGANGYLNTYLNFDRHEDALPESEQHDGVWVAREGKAPGLKSFVAEEDRMDLVNQNMYRADKSWYNTKDTTFTIDTAEELVGFMHLVNGSTSFAGKKVQLGADITLNVGKASDWYAGTGKTKLYNWIPVGNGDAIKFTGTFDGQGHTISGVYADHSADGIGLFGRVAAGSEVRDFKLTNSYFAGNSGVGSVAGWYAHGTFDTIYSDAIVHGKTTSGGHYGGMLALLGVDSTIKNCWFAGAIKSNYGYTGGIVGSVLAQANTTIESCLSTGDITGTYDIGGIVGRVTAAGTIKDSFSKATLKSTTGSGWVGKIAGRIIGVNVNCDNVYVLGSTGELFKPDGAGTISGTYAGVADLTGANGFLNTWLNFDRPELPTPTTGKWVAVTGGTPVLKSFVEFAGAERLALTGQAMYRTDTRWYDENATEFTITIAEQLIGLVSLVNGGTDFIDVTINLGDDIVINKGTTAEWEANSFAKIYNWTPIGSRTANKTFNGKFYGNGYTISGLYANGTDGMGLFGMTAATSELKDFSLLNSYITGRQGVGAIVGWPAQGTLDSIYTNATIKGTYGTDNNSGHYGGIVGVAGEGCSLSQCWFDGNITTAGRYVGGIMAWASTTGISISNCLNTGTIKSTWTNNTTKRVNAGGMVGLVASAITMNNCVVDCKEAMQMESGSTYVGTVIGALNAASTITNVYVTQGLFGTAIGTGVSNASVAPSVGDFANYKGYMNTALDFDNTWVAMEATAPRLQIFAPEEGRFDTTSWYTKAAEGAGTTEANPYIIDSLADLYGLSKRVNSGEETFENKFIKLTQSIDANEGKPSDWEETPYYVWTAIGKTTGWKNYDYAFKGTFDGGNNTVSGLYAPISEGTSGKNYSAGGWFVGLFGWAKDATIKNIRVEDSYFQGAYYVAPIVGQINNGLIENAYSNATIEVTTGNGAGIAGSIDGSTVQSCWFAGDITGPNWMGGIVSAEKNNLSTANYVKHCLFTGTVEATTNEAGGIFGRSSYNVTLEDCLSIGKVVSKGTRKGTVLAYQYDGSVTYTSVYGYADNSLENGASNATGGKVSGLTATGSATKLTDLHLVYDAEAYERLDAGYWAARVGNYPIPAVFATDADYAKTATKDAFYLGDTTFETDEDGAYLISSAAELYGLSSLSQTNNYYGVTFRLNADISINPKDVVNVYYDKTDAIYKVDGAYYEWLPIGNATYPFAGTFDGNGHTISGLCKEYEKGYDHWIGLFDTLAIESSVYDLNIMDTYFGYYNAESDSTRIGSIAGQGSGNLTNIYSNAILASSGTGTGGLIGGISVVKANKNTTTTDITISSCWFDGVVCSNRPGNPYIGGILGVEDSADVVTIQHSLVSGDVLATKLGNHVGGFVGCTRKGGTLNLTDCLFTGDQKGSCEQTTASVGFLVGAARAETGDNAGANVVVNIKQCYGVNDGASYPIGIVANKKVYVTEEQEVEVTDEAGNVSTKTETVITDVLDTEYTVTVTSDINYGVAGVSSQTDRFFGYIDYLNPSATKGQGLDFAGNWTLVNNGVPVPSYFVGEGKILAESDKYNVANIDAVLQLGYWNNETVTYSKAIDKGQGNYMLTIPDSSLEAYNAYCQQLLTAEGTVFQEVATSQNSDMNTAGVYNRVFTSAKCGDEANDDWVLNVTYVKGTIYISISTGQPLSDHLDGAVNYTTATDEGESDGYTATEGQITTVKFHMMEQNYYSAACYIMQLKNGHFIVIDGGLRGQASHIVTYLEDRVSPGYKPIVEAWIISHAHEDHTGIMEMYAKNSELANQIYVEGIYFSEGDDVVLSQYENAHHPFLTSVKRAADVFTTTAGEDTHPQVYRMMTGQRYTFDDVTMDIMLAQELITDAEYAAGSSGTGGIYNETSTWTLFTIPYGDEAYTILSGGDAAEASKTRMVNMYQGTSLMTVDVFTALHHGKNMNRLKNDDTNDDFSKALEVTSVVLCPYKFDLRDWNLNTKDEEGAVGYLVAKRINTFLSRVTGTVNVKYADGTSENTNFLYYGQGSCQLNFGDTIEASTLPTLYSATTTVSEE